MDQNQSEIAPAQNQSEIAPDLGSQETQEELKDTSRLKEMEFRTLRAEELKRIDFRYTLIQLSLASFGAILSFGVQQKLSTVLLLYPFLVLWLTLLWRQNDDMITRIRTYIAVYIEGGDLQWERMLKFHFHPVWNYDTAIKLLFVSADLITIGIGVALDLHNFVFIVVSCVCTLMAAFLLFMRLSVTAETIPLPDMGKI